MAKNKTIVNFILDKSGSMETVKAATISGFNEYISTLKKDKESDYAFTLTLFDTSVSKPVINVPINLVKELHSESYKPDGGTALYDAVVSTIRGVNEEKGQKVINIIMTDGEENSSKEFDQSHMKLLIEERTKKGNWTFVFLGANQDSYATAAKYGIATGNTIIFNTTDHGTRAAFTMSAMNTSNFASMNASTTDSFFSAQDQADLENTK